MDAIAVTLVGGKPGNGKSLYAIQRAMDHWVRGHCVAISEHLHVYWDEFKVDPETGKKARYTCKTFAREVCGVELQDEQFTIIKYDDIKDFYSVIPHGSTASPVLVILDEAHEEFNSRDWATLQKEHPKTHSFLSHARHYHCAVIFLSQSVVKIDKQFRELCQHVWHMLDMMKIGVPGLPFLRWPFPWWRFLRKQMDEDGRTVIHWEFFTLDKRLYDLYESYSDVRGVERNGSFKRLELNKVKRKLTMKNWLVILVFLGVLGWWGVHRLAEGPLGDMFHKKKPAPNFQSNPDQNPIRILEKDRTVDVKPNPAIRPAALPPAPESVYDVLEEQFLGFVGMEGGNFTSDNVLITDVCVYQERHLCKHGLVIKVEPTEAEIKQPNGRLLFVIGITKTGNGVARPAPLPHTEIPQPATSQPTAPAQYSDILSRGQAVAEGLVPKKETQDVAGRNIDLASQHQTISNLPAVSAVKH